MTRPQYEAADALVYDPVAANRNATRASLHALGFRNVEIAATVDQLSQLLDAVTPDLLMCELAGSESKICDVIQGVRQGTRGKNPFMVVCATTWRRDGTVVAQVLNSGADDLLARPFSGTLLTDRIRGLVERRKNFVVTAEYIGPDRRRDPSRAGPECIPVPNTLKIKTTGGMNAEEAQRYIATALKQARDVVDVQKMRRNAFQLCVQWRMLEQRRPGGQDFADALSRIRSLNDDIKRRADGTSHADGLESCGTVDEALAAIQLVLDQAREKSDSAIIDLAPPLQKLGEAAQALGRRYAPGDMQSGQLAEVDAVVSRINGRAAAAA
jgi:DNA-binding response OmpR family regulator